MKYGQIWMKKYAERSEAKKKKTEQLKEDLKSSILGPQNLGSGGAGPLGPPLDPLVHISQISFNLSFIYAFEGYYFKPKSVRLAEITVGSLFCWNSSAILHVI